MTTPMSVQAVFTKQKILKKFLLVCGILSSLIYTAANVFVPMQYPGYSSASQAVSELSAIGAPTRSLWVAWSFAYTFLVVAFGFGIWQSAGRNRIIRILAVLIFIYGALGFGWPFAPMHMREVLASGGGTNSDAMHIIFSIVTILLMLSAIGFGAAAFGKFFRFYSIMTIALFIPFGILTWVDAQNMEANLPTPMMGIWERVNIGLFLLWVAGLAIALLQKTALSDERKKVK